MGLFLLNSAIIPLPPSASKLCFSDRLLISQKNPSFLNRSKLLRGLRFSISFRLFATISSRIVLIAFRLIFATIGKPARFPGYLRQHDRHRHIFYTYLYNSMPCLHWPKQPHSAPSRLLPL